eukprot:GFKZ01001834.1.p1 GENE.GFKZ01001834.1~~GFKZ01001834.1.p1  ORF type:complete len:365 (+),score=45.36 GFKZ01001834.1:820-1914(+)
MSAKTQIGRLLRFSSRNVFTNLAAEERLFQRAENKSLMFYVNSDAVVLGRTQNPFKEVDVAYAAAHNIPIARRRSGGGTVVHDEGNLNFCFVRSREEHEPLSNAKLVASVLREAFGIRAVVNERADILVDGKKVSGAAYRISKGRAYHHGTLLIHSNLPRLRRLLKSPLSDGLVALGTKSVPSPVTNLNGHYSGTLHTRDVIDAIADRFSRTNAHVIPITPADVERDYGGMQAERGELCSHAWVYGKTPRFSYDYRVDDHVFKFEIDKGTVVSTVSVQSQDNSPQTPAQVSMGAMLAEVLSGQLFDGTLLAARVRSAAKNRVWGNGSESQLSRDIHETLAQRLQTDIPEQYWREDSEPSTETYN